MLTIEDLEKLADTYVLTITANTPEQRATTKLKKWGVSFGTNGGSFYSWGDTLELAIEQAYQNLKDAGSQG